MDGIITGVVNDHCGGTGRVVGPVCVCVCVCVCPENNVNCMISGLDI